MRDKPARDVGTWNGKVVAPGESRDLELHVSESYSGMTVNIPVHVRRAVKMGPVVFVTAAIHGDEINGAGAIRQLIGDSSLKLSAGALILVPVVNVLGFERNSRYLPDRRDLNRCFPGSPTGSLARRMARVVFREIVGRSDYGIDLHTAAVRRTNFPNVRGEVGRDDVRRIAEAFGAELIVKGQGPTGSLRRAACEVGCPTIILEAGEVWKVEPAVVTYAVRGIKSVLANLGMSGDTPYEPSHRITIEKTKWARANSAGFLQFHVSPGQVVSEGEPLATITSLLGRGSDTVVSPRDGIVLGMATLPVTAPGEPVCHIACLPQGSEGVEQVAGQMAGSGLSEQIRVDLSTSFDVVEHES